jgi:hypothetical protein
MYLAYFNNYIANLHKDLNKVYTEQGMTANTLREAIYKTKPL